MPSQNPLIPLSENGAPTPRKIVHIDMDAFYASVEQRDNPDLRGKPVVVAWRGNRSVVCAPLPTKRVVLEYGLRCQRLRRSVFAPERSSSRLTSSATKKPHELSGVSLSAIRILIEPLSLDEAYLDVTENKTGLPTATLVAKTIRQQIRAELNLSRVCRRRAQQVPG